MDEGECRMSVALLLSNSRGQHTNTITNWQNKNEEDMVSERNKVSNAVQRQNDNVYTNITSNIKFPKNFKLY